MRWFALIAKLLPVDIRVQQLLCRLGRAGDLTSLLVDGPPVLLHPLLQRRIKLQGLVPRQNLALVVFKGKFRGNTKDLFTVTAKDAGHVDQGRFEAVCVITANVATEFFSEYFWSVSLLQIVADLWHVVHVHVWPLRIGVSRRLRKVNILAELQKICDQQVPIVLGITNLAVILV